MEREYSCLHAEIGHLFWNSLSRTVWRVALMPLFSSTAINLKVTL